MKIQGFHVQDRLLNGNHQQITPNTPGLASAQQGELLLYLEVLVDPRLHLAGAIDLRSSGEAEGDHLPIVGLVHARGQPGHHPGLVRRRPRCERHDEHELRPLLTGELHDDVVGRHRPGVAKELLKRNIPLVRLVVELVGVLHMILEVHLRLNGEEVFRVAEVVLKERRHGIQWLEQAREDLLVRPDQRVIRVGNVEVQGAVVRVHNHLHTVAYVVEGAPERRRVRILVRNGVGILDPPHVAVLHHQVRVPVQLQERRYVTDPVLDGTPVLDAALRGQLIADQDVQVGELPGVGDLAEERAQGDAAAAIVVPVDRPPLLRLMVKLFGARVNDDEAEALFPIVYPGL